MPRLPDYTALGDAPTPQPAGGIASYDPGNARMVGLAGQELSGAGRDLEDASNIVAATNQRQDEIVARGAANQLQQGAITAEFDPNKGFRNVKGGNAVGQSFLDTYGQRFSDQATAIRASLNNDNQRRLFEQHAQSLGLQFQSALLQHQSRETDAYNDQTDNNSVDLSMRQAALDPTNELTFQSSLAQANGTVDAMAARKGLPPQAVAEVKGKILDSAYATRITSLMQGIPGVVQANPYLAEKMFEQVQDQLGPQAQVHLAAQVQKSVQALQASDIAKSLIRGSGVTAPADIAPAATGAPLQAVVMNLESGGNPDAVSPKGATSEMQVMPATSLNPGFGVRPAQLGADGQPLAGEVARVGRDYLGAMTARYNDPALTLAAYNAGPGRVDQWLAKYGDPRTGAISSQQWAQQIPFAETRNYVTKGLQQLGQPVQASAPPTANQIKSDLIARVQQGMGAADQMYPNDPSFRTAVGSAILSEGRLVVEQADAQQAAGRDTLMSGLAGSQPDGSDAPKTLQQLLADPRMKAAWDQVTPETKMALQSRFATGDQAFTPDKFNLYYRLKGLASNEPDAFALVDLGQLFGRIPDASLHELVQQQSAIARKDASAAVKDINFNRAKGDIEDMLRPLGMGRSAKAGSNNAAQSEVFYGQFSDAVQQYHDANGKWPDTMTTRKIAAGLLTEGAESGGWFWDSSKRLYQADPSQFYIPVPAEIKEKVFNDFVRAHGYEPTDEALNSEYTKYRLSGGKAPPGASWWQRGLYNWNFAMERAGDNSGQALAASLMTYPRLLLKNLDASRRMISFDSDPTAIRNLRAGTSSVGQIPTGGDPVPQEPAQTAEPDAVPADGYLAAFPPARSKR
jgi:hypothetical protein